MSGSGLLGRVGSRVRAAATAMRSDIDSVVERDPAARSGVEVALLYPGVHAVWAHRVSHALWHRGAYFPARVPFWRGAGGAADAISTSGSATCHSDASVASTARITGSPARSAR